MEAATTKESPAATMVAVSFGGCFGWLHPAAGNKAVLLCGALGYEGFCAHQPWRILADQLQAAGLPVLRFDYQGTGDSLGGDDEPGRIEAWRRSIVEAAAWLRDELEVEHISLVGLRLGAGLALQAAADIGGIDEMVLVAPVVSGRLYLREMTARAALIASELRLDPDHNREAGEVDVAGFVLTLDTAAALRRFDALDLTRRPAPHVLVLEDPGNLGIERLVTRLGGLECTTEIVPFPTYAAMMTPPTAMRGAIEGFDQIVTFLRGSGPPINRPKPHYVVPAGLSGADFSERAIRFGRDLELAGILCLPREPREGGPCVIFVNGGANPHMGWARSGVHHARRLAALGIASLRMDVGGIGDSHLIPEGPRGALYREERFDDLAAALDHLAGLGFRSFTVSGSCSGAHVAFHTAARDPRIDAIVMINLQCFGVPKEGELDAVMRSGHRTTHSYWQTMHRRDAWLRILRGDIESARLAGIARSLSGRAVKRIRGEFRARVARLFVGEGEIERKFRLLSERGVRVLMIYSEDDGGRDVLAAHMGPEGARATAMPGVGLCIIEGADHDLTPPWAQESYFELLVGHLRLARQEIKVEGFTEASPALAESRSE